MNYECTYCHGTGESECECCGADTECEWCKEGIDPHKVDTHALFSARREMWKLHPKMSWRVIEGGLNKAWVGIAGGDFPREVWRLMFKDFPPKAEVTA